MKTILAECKTSPEKVAFRSAIQQNMIEHLSFDKIFQYEQELLKMQTKVPLDPISHSKTVDHRFPVNNDRL